MGGDIDVDERDKMTFNNHPFNLAVYKNGTWSLQVHLMRALPVAKGTHGTVSCLWRQLNFLLTSSNIEDKMEDDCQKEKKHLKLDSF